VEINITKRSFIPVLPIIFLFLAVFITRSDVRWFFALAGLLLISEAWLVKKAKLDHLKMFGVSLLALASIGLGAASILTIEKIELLKDPQRVTSCSFSPIVACSPVIASPQASAFDHIPNPIFGIFGFTAVFTAGMTILAGAEKLKRPWWLALFGGTVFGISFSIWLFNAGVYQIGALCLYCLSVWLVTLSLFWIVLAKVLSLNMLKINKSFDKFIVKNRDNIITANIVLIILLLYFRWSDYWNGLL
jgi:uncharacterized membrane protein